MLETRRPKTCFAACRRRRVIKAASTTQTVIALSSEESEFCAILRGTATLLGMKSMARDYRLEVKVALDTDSVPGRGMSVRLGCREGARREHPVVMGAWSFPQARSNNSEHPYNQQRNYWTDKKSRTRAQHGLHHCTKGRLQLALRAALDGFNGKQQNRRETREHSSISADSELQSEMR